MSIRRLGLSWLWIALGVFLASATSSGISYGGDYAILLVVVILLSGLNLLLKPILVLFTLPFIVLSMGIGLWILNALLFYLVAELVSGFYVEGFGAALWGALWVSLAHFVGGGFASPQKGRRVFMKVRRHDGQAASTNDQSGDDGLKRQPKNIKDDDVIDI